MTDLPNDVSTPSRGAQDHRGLASALPARGAQVWGCRQAVGFLVAETPRPLRCLVVYGRRWRGQGRRALVWSTRHQPQDGWAQEPAPHREMVSSTRLAHLGSDRGPLPASGTVGVGGADCRAARSGSCCRPRGPLSAHPHPLPFPFRAAPTVLCLPNYQPPGPSCSQLHPQHAASHHPLKGVGHPNITPAHHPPEQEDPSPSPGTTCKRALLQQARVALSAESPAMNQRLGGQGAAAEKGQWLHSGASKEGNWHTHGCPT